jgi:hypothetical protein
VTKLGVILPRNDGSTPERGKRVPSSSKGPNRLWGPPGFLSDATGGYLSVGKAAEVRNAWMNASFRPSVFTAWRLLKQKKQYYTITIISIMLCYAKLGSWRKLTILVLNIFYILF